MAVTLIMHPEAAALLHQRDERSPVVAAISEAGGQIHSMPAFAADEPGARTFTIEIDDASTLLERLQGLPGVEACYLKPQDEAP